MDEQKNNTENAYSAYALLSKSKIEMRIGGKRKRLKVYKMMKSMTD